jgi:hypothetical protein
MANERDYPLPRGAANIWIASDVIWLGFDGHSTYFPATLKGLQLLLATLKERTKSTVIGTNGQPTQYQVERTLQRDKRWNEMLRIMQGVDEGARKEERESEEFLKDLGLL